LAFQCALRSANSSICDWPTMSSNLRKPISAMYSRTSSAMKNMKLMTCSGLPANFLRSSGSCVAMPTGQVFRWQTRIMMQPEAISGPVLKAEFLGAEQRADDDIAAGFDLAIGLQNDPAAQIVQHQRLLRFGDAQFPGQAGIFDAGQRRSAGAAAVAADENVIGLGLGDAGGDGADADFADQLHADARLGVARSSDRE
jgi:hypothetical protein